MAATSIASTMSVPNPKPALVIASEIRSSAALLDAAAGANPPSSPSAVEKPAFFSTDFSEW